MSKKPVEPEPEPRQSSLERFPDHVAAIGMISIEVANLEIELGHLLGAMLHIAPEYGRLVYLTPHANLGRLAILENVSKHCFEKKSKYIITAEKIIGKAKALIGKRHQFIHGAWGPSAKAPGEDVYLLSLPMVEGRDPRLVPLSELKETIKDLRTLGERTREFTADLYQQWPPYTLPSKLLARDAQRILGQALGQPDILPEPQAQPEASQE